ncbi:helix-turn-helix domain-containing protein [Streptomyces sp. cg28]|uniref:helix-turn-helix domain-containing protein n=1 Tax=Streptomyces sp. cg28 TaxID=3403457 RepID=UPI003B226CA8
MSARQFSGARVRARRRELDLTQAELGAPVDVDRASVAKWEGDKSNPPAHKLPAIAKALQSPLDVLFPRDGEPDLADLRCDAGYAQSEVGPFIGARSHIPVSKAERGIERLKDAYVEPLAAAYGVSNQDLLRAQNRSFGVTETATVEADGNSLPRTVGEKINYLLQAGYLTPAPSDEEIARTVNERAGQTLLTPDGVRALRAGDQVAVPPAVWEGLGAALSIAPDVFADDADWHDMPAAIEALKLMQGFKNGQILGLAARGNQQGASTEAVATINNLIAALQKLPGARPGG